MARRDLSLGESFHRVKRTLLLLCTAILITRIPGIDVTGHSGLLGVSLAEVSIDLVRWLLWAAATYYFIGFILECLTEHRSNTGSIRMGGVKGLQDDLARFSEDLQKRKDEADLALDNLNPHDLAQLVHFTTERLNELKETLPDPDTGRVMHHGQQTLAGYLKEAEGLPARVEQLKEHLAGRHEHVAKLLADINSNLTGLRADIHRLASDIIGVRKIQFFAWEIGGATAFYALATFAMPYPSSLAHLI